MSLNGLVSLPSTEEIFSYLQVHEKTQLSQFSNNIETIKTIYQKVSQSLSGAKGDDVTVLLTLSIAESVNHLKINIDAVNKAKLLQNISAVLQDLIKTRRAALHSPNLSSGRKFPDEKTIYNHLKTHAKIQLSNIYKPEILTMVDAVFKKLSTDLALINADEASLFINLSVTEHPQFIAFCELLHLTTEQKVDFIARIQRALENLINSPKQPLNSPRHVHFTNNEK